MKFNEYFKSVPVLETDRLILRPFTREDMDEYLAFVFTPEVQRYLGGGILSYDSEKHITNWLNNINGRLLKSKTVFTWCIEYKAEKKVIGRIDLGGFIKKSTAELAYHFSKEYWNMGFAKEAVGEVVRFGIEDLKLHRIQALVMPDNVYSVRALKRLGFTEEGLLRKYPFGKEFHDAVMLAIVIEQNMGVFMIIIFDLDGTLFQTEYSVVSAVKKTAESFGIKPVSDNGASYIGKTADEFLANVFPQVQITDEIKEYFRTTEREEVKNNGRLFPETVEMIKRLKERGHSLFICSNGSIEYINLVLNFTNISEYFDGIHSAKYCVSKSETVKNILGGGNSENANAVFIGDTVYDIEAAKANKIPSIVVTYGYGKAEELTGAAFSADTPKEIAGYAAMIDVFYKIARDLIYKGKRIIGINGVDTSGKTLFTKYLARFLTALNIKSEIIHIDDFHNPLEIRGRGENEIDAYYNNAFNYEQIISEILEPLAKFGSIEKHILCLNLDMDKYENIRKYSIDKETVLLIEGVLLFRPPIDKYLDGKIFLHIDFDEVIKRAKVRDVPNYGEAFLGKYKAKYIPIQKRYLSEYEPEKNCDILVNNNDYYNPRL